MVQEGKTGLSNKTNRQFWWNNLVVNKLYIGLRSGSNEERQAARNFAAAMLVSARRSAAQVPVTTALYSAEDFARQAAHQNPFA